MQREAGCCALLTARSSSPQSNRAPTQSDHTHMETFTHIPVTDLDEFEYGCDECCAFPLEKERWRCSVCSEFDACRACFEKGEHTHRTNSTHTAATLHLLEQAWTDDTYEEEGAYDSDADDAILQRPDLLKTLAQKKCTQDGSFTSKDVVAALGRMQFHVTMEDDRDVQFIRTIFYARTAFVQALQIDRSMAQSAQIQTTHALPMSRRGSFSGEPFVVQRAQDDVRTKTAQRKQLLIPLVAHASVSAAAVSAGHGLLCCRCFCFCFCFCRSDGRR